jgi:hypothetical protein
VKPSACPQSGDSTKTGKPRTLAGTRGRLVYDSRRDAPEPSGPEAETRRERRSITRRELTAWSGFQG